jgi:hypothetical protein
VQTLAMLARPSQPMPRRAEPGPPGRADLISDRASQARNSQFQIERAVLNSDRKTDGGVAVSGGPMAPQPLAAVAKQR